MSVVRTSEAFMMDHRKKKSILLVEDEKITAVDIRARLIGLGYEVSAGVATGKEAVEMAARLKPDLVLMDVVLKGSMDGVKAAEIIGKQQRIPVVFLTAFSDVETLQRAKLTEPFGFILKPCDERELHSAIEMALYKHQMERALRLSEQKFSQAFRMSPDSININRIEDGLFIDINDGFTLLTGFTREDVIGKKSTELNLWVEPEKRRLLVDGLKQHGEVKNLESDFRMKDGRVLSCLMSASIIELEEERYILSITRDISDRKRSEEALRASEARYREFFEQDMTGNFLSSADGTILDCNPAFARIFGFASVEEAKKEDPDRLYVNPEARQALYGLLERRKQLENYELEARCKDGEPLFLIENLIGIFNEHGEMTHVRGYIIDNTDRKALEQQFFHTQTMESIGTLASGIAHDFNNVLNNILGFSHQLKKYVSDEGKVMKYSECIEMSAARGTGLAKQLMSLVRKKKRENTIVDIEEIIDEVIDLATEAFPKTITVRKNIAPLLLRVMGDRGELYQAILNLCFNARDAVIERGDLTGDKFIALTVTSGRIGDQFSHMPHDESEQVHSYGVEISVTDNGIGIPETLLGKIFDPFFTTKIRGKGTGLGLSVVDNIVKSHSGTVTVKSVQGTGTTFRILLPAVDPELVAGELTGPVSLMSANIEQILLVDDEELMQELGKELLEEAGYRVLIAASGQQAIDIYRSSWKEISLVMLDFIMPDKNGGQVFEEFKAINPALKVFFCTGYAEDEMIVSLLERYKVRTLEKPFERTSLLGMIKDIMAEEVG